MSDERRQEIEVVAKALYEAPAYTQADWARKLPWAEDAPGHCEFDRNQWRIRAKVALDALPVAEGTFLARMAKEWADIVGEKADSEDRLWAEAQALRVELDRFRGPLMNEAYGEIARLNESLTEITEAASGLMMAWDGGVDDEEMDEAADALRAVLERDYDGAADYHPPVIDDPSA